MNEELKKIFKNYKKLEKQLADPSISTNFTKYNKISKELNSIKDIAILIEELEKIENGLNEAKEVIKTGEEDLITLANDQLNDLENKKKTIEKEIETLLSDQDPNNSKNALIEIRAGAGGDEAALFAADLFRMYSRYSEEKGFKKNILSSNRTGIGGFKEIIFEIRGDMAYGLLKYESGVHRVQRVPETEKAGRVHTSTVTVAVLPEVEEIDIKINSADLKIDVFRSSGPGGQSVNTTDSAIRITHLPTNTVVTCQDEKSQHQNKAKAMQILRSKLFAMEEEKQQQEKSEERKSQIGRGMRAEKIRTYNFSQDRVTDHRIKKSWKNIHTILDGQLDKIIQDLKSA